MASGCFCENTNRSLFWLCAGLFSSVFHYPKPVTLAVYITEELGMSLTSPDLWCLRRKISRKSNYFHSDSVPHAGSIRAANTPVLSGSALGPGFVSAVKAALCLQIFLWLAESLSERRSSKRSWTRLCFHLADKSRLTFMGKPLGSPSSWNWTRRCCWQRQELTTIVWQWNVNGSVLKRNNLQGRSIQ